MGFKPMLLFKNGERKGNAQVFATESEARASAKSLFMRWIQPEGFDAEEMWTESITDYNGSRSRESGPRLVGAFFLVGIIVGAVGGRGRGLVGYLVPCGRAYGGPWAWWAWAWAWA